MSIRRAAGVPDVDNTELQWLLYNEMYRSRFEEACEDPGMVAMGAHSGVVTDLFARMFLAEVFGTPWVDERFPLQDAAPGMSKGLQVTAVHRMRELARRLFEFQTFPWYEHYREHCRTNDTASAEFEGSVLRALMAWPAAEVTRNVESGNKGDDFDILLRLPMADRTVQTVHVEAKAKQDTTAFSPATVKNTLKTAVKQLPKGGIGWIFLRIPAHWIGPRLEEEYTEAVEQGVRQSSRVGAVFTTTDRVYRSPDHGLHGVRTGWHYYPRPTMPEPLVELGLSLHRLLQNADDLPLFRPTAPF